jgi:hypothetical protein
MAFILPVASHFTRWRVTGRRCIPRKGVERPAGGGRSHYHR